jgi:serine/threonine protein kinase/tetratricopeptide (TPR) repeat protein
MAQPLPRLPERYRVESLIGEGATGSVYGTWDRLLGIDVAVKVVRRNLAVHRRFRARFAREVAMSARVIHPHLVPIFDSGKTEADQPFVVMAYANAGSMAEFLDSGAQLGEMIRLFDEALDALSTLHALGYIHQDLKPPNLLLFRDVESTGDDRLHAWVSDLGEAHAMTVLAHDPKGVGGTPAYMAPEQLAQKPQEMGPWTDLYAVGLMLWEAICGRPAHRGQGRRDLLEERSRPPGVPTFPGGQPIPGALEELLDNLLDPEPRQRYDRAADVRRAMKRAMSQLGSAVRARPMELRRSRRDLPPTGPVTGSGTAPLDAVAQGPTEGSAAIRWNLVPPDPLPELVPEPSKRGLEARASLNLLALRDLPLVGRSALRQVIWDVARSVVHRKEPGVVVLVGDSGTGKTRLVESLAQPLDEGGFMEVVRLRYHWPPGLDDGYRGAVMQLLAPWHDSRDELEDRLGRWLSRDRDAPISAVASEAAVLARWCGHSKPGEPALNAAVGLAYLYRHLDARAWRGGACLVLDDAHRGTYEGDGLAIAQSLLDRSVGERPVLLLATVAAESLGQSESLRESLQRLEQRGAIILQVPPLTLDETRRVLDESLLLDTSLADEVAQICSGNPLAVSLLLRDWAARDMLELTESGVFRLSSKAARTEAVPENIEQLYVRRLQAAVQAAEDPVASAEALAATALAGQEPPAALIRGLSETGLDGLLATGVLMESGDVLTFEHGSVQQTALRLAIRLPDVAEIHSSLAARWLALAQRTGMSTDFPTGLHLMRGANPHAASGHLVRATRVLLEEGRNSLAAWAAGLAIEAADQSGGSMARQEARRLHAEALIELRQYDNAEQLIREAMTIEPIDRLTQARLTLALSRVAMGKGDLDSCRRSLHQAGVAFETVRDKDGLRDVIHGKASLERLEGRPLQAVRNFEEALALARRDPRREVLILSGLIEALLTAGGIQRVHKHRERMVEVARTSGDTRNIAQAAYTSAMVHLYQRQLSSAERDLHTASALSATLGAHWLHLNCENNLGEVARYRGDIPLAREHYERYARYAEEHALSNAAAVGRINLALLALTDRDEQEMEWQLKAAELALAQQPRHWTWVFVGLMRATQAAKDRNEPRTRAWWSVAREHGLTQLRTPDLWLPLQRLVEASAAAGWSDISQAAWRVGRDLGSTPEQVADEDDDIPFFDPENIEPLPEE